MALLKGVDCSRNNAVAVAPLVAATAAGDTYDRYTDFLIVDNGAAAAITVTITPNSGPAYTPLGGVATPAGSGPSININVPATSVAVIGVGNEGGAPNLGGAITYSAVTTVTVGAYYSA